MKKNIIKNKNIDKFYIMKNLYEYVQESIEKIEDNQINESESKSFTFNFKSINDSEDFIKSLEEQEYVTIDGEKVTVNVTDENKDKLETIIDLLQQFIDKSRKDTKNASDETYAQKTKSLEVKLGEMHTFIDSLEPEDNEEDNKKDKEGCDKDDKECDKKDDDE